MSFLGRFATYIGALIPLLLACGILFDVGSMHYIDLNMFTAFTVSDHILFVAQRIPLLLVGLSLMAALGFVLYAFLLQLGGDKLFEVVWRKSEKIAELI